MTISDPPAIFIEELDKSFVVPRPLREVMLRPFQRRRLSVLKKVSLQVSKSSSLSLLGPNGSGKSTLLRILAASILPDRGRVTILGADTSRQPTRVRKQLGFVLGEERSFFWRLTGFENLRFFATLYDLPKNRIGPRIKELAVELDLGAELEKPFRDLSTGVRQRMSIARALLHDPEVLLFDEPTRALDPGSAKKIRTLIRETLCEKMSKTILLATHNLEEARQISQYSAFLKAGKIMHFGPTEECLPKIAALFDGAES